ncbi:hypothetical protein [Phytoactinopolyspora mesophila]|uniref:DUF2567 domain-containing protein n=1 Tax=Phytoactinopolyspora mesophila TaxID=2650750 RepID=A0A7K3M853_9ACTN|nr:hypothetical protein [Phytoactinopolyspora mesophila]NDL59177.1 hypothetical protein [Phytoactinopolyspora mesophila]
MSRDPWAWPASSERPPQAPGTRDDTPSGARTRTGRRNPLPSTRKVAAEIGVTSVVVGVLFGVAWLMFTPDITGQVAEEGVAVPIAEARQLFDRVAVFSLLGAAIGILLGAVFGPRHRRRPVTTLLALATGGFGGSLLAMGVGILLGPSAVNDEPGTEVQLPMELEAPAALFVWPLLAIIVVTLMSLFRDDRSPWIWDHR